MVVTGDMRGVVENNGSRPAGIMRFLEVFGGFWRFWQKYGGIHCSYAGSAHPRQLSLQLYYSGKIVPKKCLQLPL